jgi:phasin family protein
MYSIPEQLSALNKSNVDAMVAFFGITSAGAERLLDFQMKTAKTVFADAMKDVQALTSIKDPQQWTQMGATFAQPAAEKLSTYFSHLSGLTTKTQSEIARHVEEHISALNSQIVSMLDQAAKNGPAGSDVAVAAAKSAVAAANQAYDAFAQAGRQMAEMTESTVQSVASAGLQAANSTIPTSKKKAA